MTLTAVESGAVLDDRIARLAPIDLDGLVERAGLQTRVDRKYVLRLSQLLAALDRCGNELLALDIEGRRRFGYHSMYFDTADLTSFRDHRQGRRRRSKVRTRLYVDSGQCMLEVKAPDTRGRTVKYRYPYSAQDANVLTATGLDFVRGALPAQTDVAALVPVLAIDYRRITLLDPVHATRMTIDLGLSFAAIEPAAARPGADGTDGRRAICPSDVAIVETKSSSGAGPADRALWALGVRPVSMSKYCVGIALTHPALAANRWHRVITRQLVT